MAVYNDLVRTQVHRVAGRYVQSVLLDHIYRRTMKKVVRMMLFQVIQECVDLVYFLEEDTISTANHLLDKVMRRELVVISKQAVDQCFYSYPQVHEPSVGLTIIDSQLEDEDQLQEICDQVTLCNGR